MKIIYLFRSMCIFGGIERILTDKMNYLTEAGHDVILITYDQGTQRSAFPLLPKVAHIDLGVFFYKQYQYGIIKRLWMSIKLKKELCKKLAQQIAILHPDIVIGISGEFATLHAMMQLKDASKKIIEVHVNRVSVEKVNTSHASILKKIAFKQMDRQMIQFIQQSDAFVTLTHNDAKDWAEIRQLYVIPNLLTYYPPSANHSNICAKKIITAGRLTEQKGYDLLLKSWEIIHRTHPDWRLDIYGDGEEKKMIEQEIEQRGLMKVITIHEPTRQIYEKYQESDIYVMSSRWEGFGLVLAEAMSCGIPCVSFDCPHGPSDIIHDGEDGILVENGNIAQLAEKICYLIEHEDIRRKMGTKARENIKRYLPENIIPQWETLFNQLLK